MVEIKIKNDGKKNNLIYDLSEYSIECFCEKGSKDRKDSFILKRKKCDEIMKIFTGDITDIIQCKKNGYNYFVVIEYPNTRCDKCNISCYKDDGSELSCIFSKDCRECKQITNSSFLLEFDVSFSKELNLIESEYALYNIDTYRCGFSQVYSDSNISNRLNEVIDDKVLFVKENLCSKNGKRGHKAEDTIIYGIDPKTFDAKTKIWSDLQQRYIDILSEEEIKEKEAKYVAKDMDPNSIFYRVYRGKTLGDKTIGLEIQLPLEEIAIMMQKNTPNIFVSDTCGEINKEFVKGFKN